MTKTALVAAITSVSAFLSIPLGPVPITMQSCVVLVAGPVLGARLGALSQIIYLAMGFVGLPVFAGGRAGMGVVMTPTFGYLLGFVAAAYLTGLMTDRISHLKVPFLIFTMLVGLAVIMLSGVSYLYANFNYVVGQEMSWGMAWSIGVLPFLPGEILKLTAATAIVLALQKHGFSGNSNRPVIGR